MTDWHCHILPGLDDGAKTPEESLLMAHALAESGFVRVCCTPHGMKGLYDNSPDDVRYATRRLQQRVVDNGLALTLIPGMEYVLDEFLLGSLADPLLLPGNMLLVEIPQAADPGLAAEILYQLILKKITPLIAHPERCDLFSTTRPERRTRFDSAFSSPKSCRDAGDPEPIQPAETSFMARLRGIGCAFQGNLGSFAGMYGDRVKEQACSFLSAGIYSRFGSDLHSFAQCRILEMDKNFLLSQPGKA